MKRTATKSGIEASPEAMRRASAILDVLGGLHTPGEAAEVLEIGVSRYYMLEAQAIEGLVCACEPQPKGKQVSPEREIEKLLAQIKRLESERGRYQALLRASQRALGVKLPKGRSPEGQSPEAGKDSDKGNSKKRRRRTTTRALSMSKVLKEKIDGESQGGQTAGGQPPKGSSAEGS